MLIPAVCLFGVALNAWISDDAYITFRTISHFLEGHGLRWNIAERVQSYTHPLWMMLITAGVAITREYYFTVLALSLLVSAAVLWTLWDRTGAGMWKNVLLCGLLVSSKAFVEYSTSGLENPLTHFWLAVFFIRYFRVEKEGVSCSAKELAGLYGLASMAYLTRPDAILLYVPALCHASVGVLSRTRRAGGMAILLGILPAVAWHVFSLVYYGFIFPNTYYAKLGGVGLPAGLLWRQGGFYVLQSLKYDPVTVAVILCALVALLAVGGARSRGRCMAAGLVLYLLYVVRIGGDFMSGRFFSAPYLLATMALVRAIWKPGARWAVLGLLLLYNLFWPFVPLKMSRDYKPWDADEEHGIADERGYYQSGSALLFYRPGQRFPDNIFIGLGHAARRSGTKVHFSTTLGFSGFAAGSDLHIVDKLGLSDPLLARLPISASSRQEFQVGHYAREIPAGYRESCEAGENRIVDPELHKYAGDLFVITRGPLFTRERWRAIWRYNFGDGRTYRKPYQPD